MNTTISEENKSTIIAEQNDRLRKALGHPRLSGNIPGHLVLTAGIAALEEEKKTEILEKVCHFSSFTEDNDPHGEHDFGAFNIAGVGKIFWKFDYYDHSLQHGSEDPADLTKTFRVLTVMLAEEY